jgi:hypothetical protein
VALLTATLLLAQLVTPAPGDVETGYALQYAPGRMLEVVRNRQRGCCGRYGLPYGLPPVDGYVAAQERADIGRLVWIRPAGDTEWELFLVADCGGFADGGYEWMRRNRILFEIDAATAARWGTVGRLIEVETKPVPLSLRRMWEAR